MNKALTKNNDSKKNNFKNLIKFEPLKFLNNNNQNDNKPVYSLNHYKASMGIFSKVYQKRSMWWRVFIMVIVGIISSISSLFFVQNTGVYVSGTSGILQGIARIARVFLKKSEIDNNVINLSYQLMFYGLYLISNIPLMIFSWKKLGRKFTFLSIITILISNTFPLALNQIPGVNNFFIFGDIRPKIDEYHAELINFDVQLLSFAKDGEKVVFLFLYTFFAALLNGIGYALAISVGGSTGGLDFITFYFVYKKKKPINSIFLIFNGTSVFISSIIGSFISGGIVDSKYFTYYNFFSQNLMTGVIYVIIINIVISQLFPKDKIVKIQIFCEETMALRDHLYSLNFHQSLTIIKTIGGYSLKEKQIIEIVCLFIELPKLLHQIKEFKKSTMITITEIKGIDGDLRIENNIA